MHTNGKTNYPYENISDVSRIKPNKNDIKWFPTQYIFNSICLAFIELSNNDFHRK